MGTINRRTFRNQLAQEGVSLKDKEMVKQLGELGITKQDLKDVDTNGDSQIKGDKECDRLFDVFERKLDSRDNGKHRLDSNGKAGNAYKAVHSSSKRQKPIGPSAFKQDYAKWSETTTPGRATDPTTLSRWMGKQYGLSSTQQKQAELALKHCLPTNNTAESRIFAYARIAELARSGKLKWTQKKLDPSVVTDAVKMQIAFPKNADAVQNLLQDKKFGTWTKSVGVERGLVHLAGIRGKAAHQLLQDKNFRQTPAKEAAYILNAHLQSPTLCKKLNTWMSYGKSRLSVPTNTSTASIKKDLSTIKEQLKLTTSGNYGDQNSAAKKLGELLADRPWLWHSMDKSTLKQTTGFMLKQLGLSASMTDKSGMDKDTIKHTRLALANFKEDNPQAYKALIGGSLAKMGAIDGKSLFTNLRNAGLSETLGQVAGKLVGDSAGQLLGPVLSGLVQGTSDMLNGKSAGVAMRNAYISGLVGGIGAMAGAGPIGALGTIPLELATEYAINQRVKQSLSQLFTSPDIAP